MENRRSLGEAMNIHVEHDELELSMFHLPTPKGFLITPTPIVVLHPMFSQNALRWIDLL